MCAVKNSLKEIYKEAFGEDTEFSEKLFDTCFSYCRYLKVEGKTAAMLFALPCDIKKGENVYNSLYIFAAATKKEYRGKGYMSSLIKELQKEDKILFLKPASEELITFYEKLGFCSFTAQTYEKGDIKAIPKGGFAELSINEAEEEKFSYIAMCSGNKIPLDNMYFPFIME